MYLGERYRLQEIIGHGGTYTIYRGIDTQTDRDIAIKVLNETYSKDPKFITHFQREAKAMHSLQHPNIVQVYDYGQTDSNYYIVMEYVKGTDLRRYLRSRGTLSVERTIAIAHSVSLALETAHRQGIIHRAVTPMNILIAYDNTIKLTNFAAIYNDMLQVVAPEQVQGEIVTPATDIYALGIVLYEMLTGSMPFDASTAIEMAMKHITETPQPHPNIPEPLEAIIMKCLEKSPDKRYHNGSELAKALKDIQQMFNNY